MAYGIGHMPQQRPMKILLFIASYSLSSKYLASVIGNATQCDDNHVFREIRHAFRKHLKRHYNKGLENTLEAKSCMTTNFLMNAVKFHESN